MCVLFFVILLIGITMQMNINILNNLIRPLEFVMKNTINILTVWGVYDLIIIAFFLNGHKGLPRQSLTLLTMRENGLNQEIYISGNVVLLWTVPYWIHLCFCLNSPDISARCVSQTLSLKAIPQDSCLVLLW